MKGQALLWAVLLGGCSVNPDAPRAAAMRVSSYDQLIGGPKALGQIGDYLLENDQIRVIISEPGIGRSNTLFGGALLDADLQRPAGGANRGNDQMGELLPSFVLETMNPVTMRITADGKDGQPAVVTQEGTDGELLQMVAILSNGILYPPNLRFKEEYKLAPGKRYVELTTTITNATTGVHPMPYLNPSQFKNLGLDVPGVDSLAFSAPLGHLLLFGAENSAFVPGVGGFNLRFAIEDSYKTAHGFPAFPGLVTEFIATRGRGVSYGLMVPPSADNYVHGYKDLYEPMQETTDHSMLIPYVYAAVTGVYTTDPPAVLQAGESFSFKSYFVIGRGDVGSILDVMLEIRGVPTGAFAGRIYDAQTQAPIARASVVVQDGQQRFVDQLDTDENGAFRGNLPPGHYNYRVVTDVRPTTPSKSFDITVGAITSVMETLDPPARIAVQVVDELGRPVPAKVALVGHFGTANRGKDPRTFLYDLRLGEHARPTTLDPNRDEYIENSWYTVNGALSAEVRPGEYQLAISRGVEYDLHTEPVVLKSGAFVSSRVALRRAFDTSGYIAADFHVHSRNSTDSSLTLEDRVTSMAGEGLDFAAATDHNFLTDYAPTIAKLGLQDWFSACVGLELTTFEMGHFNGFPLVLDPGNVKGADFVWAGETPASLFRQLRALGPSGEDTVVEVNHARDGVLGYFTQFNLDTETGEAVPRKGLRAVFAPFKPEFAPEAFSYDFDVLEVMNAKRHDLMHAYRAPDPLPPGPLPDPAPVPGAIIRDADGRVAFPGQIDDWFTFLSRGLTYTATGNSDSHTTVMEEPGYPRNFVWVGRDRDIQGKFGQADVVAGLRSHRVVITNGPMVDMTIDGQPIGSTVKASGSSALLKLHVVSANWAPFDTVKVWSNGEIIHSIQVGAQNHDYETTLQLPLARDAWFVVEVTGETNLFPVLPPQEFEPLNVDAVINALGAGLDLTGLSPSGNLKPARTFTSRPEALTNPIWVDWDGNGKFDPPRPPIVVKKNAKASPIRKTVPDVRSAFEAVDEVQP